MFTEHHYFRSDFEKDASYGERINLVWISFTKRFAIDHYLLKWMLDDSKGVKYISIEGSNAAFLVKGRFGKKAPRIVCGTMRNVIEYKTSRWLLFKWHTFIHLSQNVSGEAWTGISRITVMHSLFKQHSLFPNYMGHYLMFVHCFLNLLLNITTHVLQEFMIPRTPR